MNQSESVLLPQSATLTVSKAKGKTYDVVIVGAGPAGIAAAVYLKRAGVNPLVFERDEVGGLLRNAHLVENYPGFPDGVSGPELVEMFKRQLVRWSIDVRMEEVHKVSKEGDKFLVMSESGDIFAKSVIIATGTKPRRVDIPGLEDVELTKVFYEIVDIPSSAPGNVLVLGGGDAAFDYALNLAGKGFFADVVFRGEPKCLPLLLERANRSDKVRLRGATELRSFREKDRQLVVTLEKGGSQMEAVADFGLIACGREADLDVLPLELSENWAKTPGIHLVGDVRRGNFRQVGIAVGDGILTAMSIVQSRVGE